MSIVLAQYQRRAIEELKDFSLGLLKGEFFVDKNLIVFASPTGSGKTVMLSKYIEEMLVNNNKLAFIWFSPGDGDLIKQSYKSVKKNISSSIRCTLLDGKEKRLRIHDKEIFFVNWEKVNKKNNKLNREGDLPTFKEMINNAKDNGTNVVVIIDEFHFKGVSERADAFLEDLNYNVKLGVSATPTVDSNLKVVVSHSDVISEGFIKKDVILNSGIVHNILKEDIKEYEGFDYSQSDFDLLMSKAYNKRVELEKAYKDEGFDIVPLVLIQIPNGPSSKELYKKEIIEFLTKRGIRLDEIAWHFEGDRVNNEDLDDKNKDVKFFIFKQAIATGWDCPRSHILVRFRDISSETFNIQTLGRILRVVNPIRNKYKNEILKHAYLYTNSSSTVNDISKFDADYVMEEVALKEEFSQFTLPSFEYKQLDKTLINEGFVFDRIKEYMTREYSLGDFSKRIDHNLSQLKRFGWDVSFKSMNKLISESKLDIHDKLNGIVEEKEFETILKDKHESQLQMENSQFTSHLTTVLKTLDKNQVENLLKAFSSAFVKREPNGNNYYKQLAFINTNQENIKHLFLNVFDLFDEYSGINKEIVNKVFVLPDIISYSTQNHKRAGESDLPEVLRDTYAYSDYYFKYEENSPEYKFVKNLGFNIIARKPIRMWWKNIDHGKEGFAIKYNIDGYEQLTFPDFIIEFLDGTLGIFEVKSEQEFSKWSKVKLETRQKMEALSEYIAKRNLEDSSRLYIGGVVAESNGRHKIYLHGEDQKGQELNKYLVENFMVGVVTTNNRLSESYPYYDRTDIDDKQVENSSEFIQSEQSTNKNTTIEVEDKKIIEDNDKIENKVTDYFEENKYTKLFYKILKGSKKAMTLYEMYKFADEYRFLITVGFPSEKIIHEWDWYIYEDVVSGRFNVTKINGRNHYFIEGETTEFPEKLEDNRITLKELVEIVLDSNINDNSVEGIFKYVMRSGLYKDLGNMDPIMIKSGISRTADRLIEQNIIELVSEKVDKMTFTELAINVLKRANDKLTVSEVWEAAENLGWIGYLQSKGKTPEYSLSSRMIEAVNDGKLKREKIKGVYKYYL